MRRHVLPAEPRLPDARRSPHIRGRHLQHRSDCEECGGRNRERTRKHRDPRRHPKVPEKRHSSHDVRWNQAAQQLNRPVRRYQCEHRPERDKDNRLGDELANHPDRGRAKRRADRHFTPAAFGADEQQAAHVHGSTYTRRSPAPLRSTINIGRIMPTITSCREQDGCTLSRFDRDTPSRAAAQRRSYRSRPTGSRHRP